MLLEPPPGAQPAAKNPSACPPLRPNTLTSPKAVYKTIITKVNKHTGKSLPDKFDLPTQKEPLSFSQINALYFNGFQLKLNRNVVLNSITMINYKFKYHIT